MVLPIRSFILWSGGKESYLSYKKAFERGFSIDYALSYVETSSKRLIGCYLREDLVREQTGKLGMEFVPVYGSRRKGDFLRSMADVLSVLPVEAGVFGDIYQKEHRRMLEKVCSGLSIRPVFPLWGMDEKVVLNEVLKMSKPLIVCRRIRKLPRRFLGSYLDDEMIDFLEKEGLSVSGEGGEYQTFVVRCEEFDMKVDVLKTFRKSYYECIDLVPGGES